MQEIISQRKSSRLWKQGRRIAAARVEAGLSQQELADAIAIGLRQIISNIERGKRDISADELRAIASATNKDIHYFDLSNG